MGRVYNIILLLTELLLSGVALAELMTAFASTGWGALGVLGEAGGVTVIAGVPAAVTAVPVVSADGWLCANATSASSNTNAHLTRFSILFSPCYRFETAINQNVLNEPTVIIIDQRFNDRAEKRDAKRIE